MGLLTEIHQRSQQAIGPLVGFVVVVYFVFHLVQGQRGLLSWLRLQQEVARAEENLETVRTERQTLDQKVALLRPDQLDQDMLDERARQMLGFARSDEVIVLLGE